MKTTLMKAGLGMLALGLMTGGAQADWNRGGHAYTQARHQSQQINARQDRQAERIRTAMRTGQLTRPELRALMNEQHEIRAMERRFRADGIIGPHEYRRLDRALDSASRHIRAEAHDRQARSAYRHPSRFN
jgi:hypothetical protein